jgi:predicted DNA binding CopG/RHH family protein
MVDNEFEYIDDEEKELIESIEATPVEDLKPASPDYKKKMQRAAQEHVRSEQTKMNIRINRSDLEKIKERAAREGLKYQSLVKSVLHKYITGQLTESDKRSG